MKRDLEPGSAPVAVSPAASEEHVRLLVEGVVDYAILTLDPQGHVASWNAGAERIKGYEAHEIIGQHFSRFYPAEDVAAGKPARGLEVAAAVGRFEDEGWRVRKDGSRFWANVVISALRDDSGTLCGFGKVTRDLTVRKQAEEHLKQLNETLRIRAEELASANADLEAFSYSVAHDLRAPLRQIIGFSKLLLEDHGSELDGEAQRFLRKIEDGTRHMGQLVDDLLNLARVGRQSLVRVPTNLGTLVRSVVEDLAPEYRRRDVEWRIGELFVAECDPGLMRQAFVNLLSNALKFTRLRDRAVIEIGHERHGGENVVFVRDDGVGFDMQYASKLFGVFQRLHKEREFEGTGVGLAIVHRVIRKHGGRIWAEAELKRGATFFFTLRGEA
jgi:PAS domain S-box-containing protein